MRERRAWWWNGRWGRTARRDVKIYVDGSTWLLEDIQGGVEGRVRTIGDLTESGAFAAARELMLDIDEWRDMMAT